MATAIDGHKEHFALLNLPNELLLQALEQLPDSNLSNFRLASRAFNNLGLAALDIRIKSGALRRDHLTLTVNDEHNAAIFRALSHSELRKNITKITLTIEAPPNHIYEKIHMTYAWRLAQPITPSLGKFFCWEGIWLDLGRHCGMRRLGSFQGNALAACIALRLWLRVVKCDFDQERLRKWGPWLKELERRYGSTTIR